VKKTAVLLFLLLVLLLVGCTREGMKEAVLTPWEKWVKTPVESLSEDRGSLTKEPGEPAASKESGETVSVALYFVQNGALKEETHDIPKVTGIARRSLTELFKGPRDSRLKSAFPAGTRLNDITLDEDGTCTVDLSASVLGLKGEPKRLAIDVLTNTLGQFPTIKKVKVLIEGEINPDWYGPWRVGEFR